jgi:hypothetical protein
MHMVAAQTDVQKCGLHTRSQQQDELPDALDVCLVVTCAAAAGGTGTAWGVPGTGESLVLASRSTSVGVVLNYPSNACTMTCNSCAHRRLMMQLKYKCQQSSTCTVTGASCYKPTTKTRFCSLVVAVL